MNSDHVNAKSSSARFSYNCLINNSNIFHSYQFEPQINKQDQSIFFTLNRKNPKQRLKGSVYRSDEQIDIELEIIAKDLNGRGKTLPSIEIKTYDLTNQAEIFSETNIEARYIIKNDQKSDQNRLADNDISISCKLKSKKSKKETREEFKKLMTLHLLSKRKNKISL